MRGGHRQVALPPEVGRHRRAPERRASYCEVLAVREFRWLWIALVLSFAGDQFAQVAIAILIFRRTDSAFLTALAYLPPIADGPFWALRALLFCTVLVSAPFFSARSALIPGIVRA